MTLKVTPKVSGLRNTVLRLGTSSTTHFIDSAGTGHPITTGGVFNCLTAWKGHPVVAGATQAQVDAFPSGPPATCTVPEAANKILRLGSTPTTYLVDESGVRHPIPTGGVFNCLTGWKATPVLSVSQAQLESFATGGNATCSVPEAVNKVLRLGASDSTWIVDAAGSRRPIRTGGVFNCLTAWKGMQVLSVSQVQLDAFGEGADARCDVPDAAKKIIRRPTGASWFVDGGGLRHPIPTGAVFNCLTLWRSIGVIDGVSQAQVESFAEGAPQTCSPPNTKNKVIRQANGASWYVDSGGTKHPIPDGGVFNCMTAWQGKAVLDVTAPRPTRSRPAPCRLARCRRPSTRCCARARAPRI